MVPARRLRRFAMMAAAVLGLCGCAAPSLSGAPTGAASPSPSAAPSVTPADRVAALTLDEKVAQLFMVGVPVDGDHAATLSAIRDDGVGGLFLHGPATGDIEAIAKLVDDFTEEATSSLPLWVATDQEGGQVQVLGGAGFDAIPSAVEQGWMAAELRDSAAQWGDQLAEAGITMNLAPVADIVPTESAAKNPPIGALDREYGGDEKSVAAGAAAFAAGMRDAGILPTFKHFPGLGRVAENTDFRSDVVDDVITAASPDVDVYRTLLDEGPAVVMMSTATYTKIDPDSPAAFSPAVVSVLRNDVGFDGVVTTDDLSAAAQVEAWSPAERATMAIDAGVDLLLVSSDPSVYPEMRDAVLQRATDDPAFAQKVDDAALRIATAKAG